MAVNEKKHVLKEYALAKSNGDSARANAIMNANGKWISQAEFAVAS